MGRSEVCTGSNQMLRKAWQRLWLRQAFVDCLLGKDEGRILAERQKFVPLSACMEINSRRLTPEIEALLCQQ